MEFWVAIIDQGINRNYARLLNTEIEEVIIKKDGSISGENSLNEDHEDIWHGTNIASIIVQAAPTVKILSIRLERHPDITVKQLCVALHYCTSIKLIKVVNISLGILTNKTNPDLERSCWECYQSGKILVAAAHMDNRKFCFPAAFPFVYGVGTGLVKDRSSFTWLDGDYINILAKGVYQRLAGAKGEPVFAEGTSYAAAVFTGIVSDILIKNPAFKKREVDNYLKENSVYSFSMHFPVGEQRQTCSVANIKLQDSLVFPTDDDRIEQLALQSERLKYVMKYPVDPDAKFRFKNEENKIIIPGIISRKIFTKLNTLVVGNFLNNLLLVNRLFGWSLVDFFLDNNAHLIVLDNYILENIRGRITERHKSYKGFIQSL